jgi:hypothetical protein
MIFTNSSDSLDFIETSLGSMTIYLKLWGSDEKFGTLVQFTYDTGASKTVLTKKSFSKLGLDFEKISDTTEHINSTAGGGTIGTFTAVIPYIHFGSIIFEKFPISVFSKSEEDIKQEIEENTGELFTGKIAIDNLLGTDLKRFFEVTEEYKIYDTVREFSMGNKLKIKKRTDMWRILAELKKYSPQRAAYAESKIHIYVKDEWEEVTEENHGKLLKLD